MHSVIIKHFKILELIHFLNKFSRGGEPKPGRASAPPAPLKETLLLVANLLDKKQSDFVPFKIPYRINSGLITRDSVEQFSDV